MKKKKTISFIFDGKPYWASYRKNLPLIFYIIVRKKSAPKMMPGKEFEYWHILRIKNAPINQHFRTADRRRTWRQIEKAQGNVKKLQKLPQKKGWRVFLARDLKK